MSDYVASLIRTYVPLAVSALVTWLASIGVLLPEDSQSQLALFLGALAGAAYYALVRVLEKKFPWVGNFLGVAKAPVYVAPAEIKPGAGPVVADHVLGQVEDLYDTRTLRLN